MLKQVKDTQGSHKKTGLSVIKRQLLLELPIRQLIPAQYWIAIVLADY